WWITSAEGACHERRGCTAPLWPCRLCHLLCGHRLARGAALFASTRALPLRPGEAAGLAVHLRRRLPAGARRVDHPALSNLRALQSLRDAGLGWHDPTVQRHANVSIHGLRPGDRRDAHLAALTLSPRLSFGFQAGGRRGRIATAGLRF